MLLAWAYVAFAISVGAGVFALAYGLAGLAGLTDESSFIAIPAGVAALFVGVLGLFNVHALNVEEDARVARWGKDWDRGIL